MQRATEFLDKLINKLNKESPEIHTVFIVTHAATKIALGRALLKNPELDVRTGVCSLDTYVVDPESGKWVAKTIGQTDYLADGEEMHWSFGKCDTLDRFLYLFLFFHFTDIFCL